MKCFKTWTSLLETKTVLEDRSLAYCNDVENYEKFVRIDRKIPLDKKMKRKIGCDGGGDHFKVTMNLVDEEEVRPGSPSNPKKRKKRDYLPGSVRATLILANVQHIPETRANVKTILDKLNLHSENFAFTLNSDLKLINIIVGIQGHTSSCPCPYCEWLKKDGVDGEPAELRTKGGIR